MTFFTEASIDLAEDPELMGLMVERIKPVSSSASRARMRPRPASPGRSKTCERGPLVDKVRRIQDARMEVRCGMLLGFDHDATIFDTQSRFVGNGSGAFGYVEYRLHRVLQDLSPPTYNFWE